ncbi:MAG: pantoate--beta-alanine ligase [Acidimicrobiales bacterium]|jgi:pantoate--beta-alanine ligase
METYETVAELRSVLNGARERGHAVGMVGTSGAIHKGHLSLVEQSAKDNDITVMFWGGGGSFEWMASRIEYERDLARDMALAQDAGLDAVFTPLADEFFPREPMTQVRLPAMSSGVPGLEDPAHLDLIAMVMCKLWNMFGPCRSYFGEKDWQQLAMYRRLADDLCWPVEVVGCPTIREGDGLAISSRNSQLTPEQREAAPILYRALLSASEAANDGERSPDALIRQFTRTVGDTATVQYFTAVEADTMARLDALHGRVRLLASIGLGSVRLVDNLGLELGS